MCTSKEFDRRVWGVGCGTVPGTWVDQLTHNYEPQVEVEGCLCRRKFENLTPAAEGSACCSSCLDDTTRHLLPPARSQV